MSDYLEDKLARLVLSGTSFTPPAVYMALYTASPTDADTGTEVAGGLGYSRVLIPSSTWAFVGGAFQWWQNTNAAIQFGPATGSWGTVTHWGLRDASSAGNLLIWGSMNPSVAVVSPQLLTFLAGNAIIIQFA